MERFETNPVGRTGISRILIALTLFFLFLTTGITDCLGNAADSASLEEDLVVIRNAYHLRSADAQLKIVPEKPDMKPDDYFLDWIE
jgi:hypothetical protein